MGPEALDLAAIVIAVGARPQLVAAVRSLLAQQQPLEIVVVNSGGGDAKALLSAAGIHLPVISREELLTPAAARNLGIAATRARYVSFLAEDCLATPGWAAARLAAHRAGHDAVASALLNDRPRNPIAWAAHIYLYYRRLPGTPPDAQLVYGVSYDRALFERHGLFREELRIGEDTEFNARLTDAARPVWSSEVRTMHRTPGGVTALIRDHHHRGLLFAEARALRGLSPAGRRLVLWYLGAVLPRMTRGLRWSAPRHRFAILLGFPFAFVGAIAYAHGAVTRRYQRTAEVEAAEETSTHLAG